MKAILKKAPIMAATLGLAATAIYLICNRTRALY